MSSFPQHHAAVPSNKQYAHVCCPLTPSLSAQCLPFTLTVTGGVGRSYCTGSSTTTLNYTVTAAASNGALSYNITGVPDGVTCVGQGENRAQHALMSNRSSWPSRTAIYLLSVSNPRGQPFAELH